jgi:hypothetical protein
MAIASWAASGGAGPTGRVARVTGLELIARYRNVPLVPLAPGERDQFVTITTEIAEGRRVSDTVRPLVSSAGSSGHACMLRPGAHCTSNSFPSGSSMVTQYSPCSVPAITSVAPRRPAVRPSHRHAHAGPMAASPGRLPAFTSRCRQFLTALGLGAPQTELLHLPRSAKSAKVPPRRDVSPYLVSPILRRQEGRSPGLLAARLPGNSTYDNPR